MGKWCWRLRVDIVGLWFKICAKIYELKNWGVCWVLLRILFMVLREMWALVLIVCSPITFWRWSEMMEMSYFGLNRGLMRNCWKINLVGFLAWLLINMNEIVVECRNLLDNIYLQVNAKDFWRCNQNQKEAKKRNLFHDYKLWLCNWLSALWCHLEQVYSSKDIIVCLKTVELSIFNKRQFGSS